MLAGDLRDAARLRPQLQRIRERKHAGAARALAPRRGEAAARARRLRAGGCPRRLARAGHAPGDARVIVPDSTLADWLAEAPVPRSSRAPRGCCSTSGRASTPSPPGPAARLATRSSCSPRRRRTPRSSGSACCAATPCATARGRCPRRLRSLRAAVASTTASASGRGRPLWLVRRGAGPLRARRGGRRGRARPDPPGCPQAAHTPGPCARATREMGSSWLGACGRARCGTGIITRLAVPASRLRLEDRLG